MKNLPPAQNKFHVGNGDDGKHYWLTPPDLYAELNAEFQTDKSTRDCIALLVLAQANKEGLAKLAA